MLLLRIVIPVADLLLLIVAHCVLLLFMITVTMQQLLNSIAYLQLVNSTINDIMCTHH